MIRAHSISARSMILALVIAVLVAAQPMPSARAESGGVDSNLTVGLLVVVVGVLGWVAWKMEKEDRADSFQARTMLPVYEKDDSALGFVFDPASRDDAGMIFTAGLAVGRRF